MIYAFGDYTLDIQRCELRRAGILCQLEPQALDLLVYLLQHRDRVVTKQEILEHLWPGDRQRGFDYLREAERSPGIWTITDCWGGSPTP